MPPGLVHERSDHIEAVVEALRDFGQAGIAEYEVPSPRGTTIVRVEVGSSGGGHHVEVGRVTADTGQVDLGVEGGPAQGLARRFRASHHRGGSPHRSDRLAGPLEQVAQERPVQKYFGRQVDVRPRRQLAGLLEPSPGFRISSGGQQHPGLQPDPGHPVAVDEVIAAQQLGQRLEGDIDLACEQASPGKVRL